VEQGAFRKDLNYRLRTHHIHLLPLRERLDDVPLLVDHFLRAAAAQLNQPKPQIPDRLLTLLSGYSFPGNVRELRMMVFDAASQNTQRVLSLEPFKRYIAQRESESDQLGLNRLSLSAMPLPDDRSAPVNFAATLPTLKQATELLIKEAMQRSKGNQGQRHDGNTAVLDRTQQGVRLGQHMFDVEAGGDQLGFMEQRILAASSACSGPPARHEPFASRRRRYRPASCSPPIPPSLRWGRRCSASTRWLSLSARTPARSPSRITAMSSPGIGSSVSAVASISAIRVRIAAPLIHVQFATARVGGLNAGGAFVDGGDASIAQVLAGTAFLDITHAAVDLHPQRSDFDADFGGPALDHRNQQVHPGLMGLRVRGSGWWRARSRCMATT
jgi:hypothetical protein